MTAPHRHPHTDPAAHPEHRHDHRQDGHADDHGHDHPSGLKGWLHEVFVPHSHDAADSIDDALEASGQGIRAVKISLVVLGLTAAAQLAIVAISGSVALLADTIHNFSDALTAIPLWIAFVLGRRAATNRYTYGFGRVEDLAGLFIVAMIALSAIVAGVESVRRLAVPQPLDNLGWVLAAGVIGFAGNEAVAVYRIRVGRRIGSAALLADGVHARADGFTSLAVVLGVIGVWAGFPLADPIVGMLITAAILVLLWGTARDVGRRLLDGVDPDLTQRARHTLERTAGIEHVTDVRLRWTGHRLAIQARVCLDPDMTITMADQATAAAAHDLRHALPAVGDVDITTTAKPAHPAITGR
ncbi:cation diffusion facilitator family transporter [Isoptericola variabilis]|uniref:Cation diffusion facilitator family transporter n=1 Tax=Isoptericola variabilis (strain 225) TaxID=743718 RepID=F6FR30_ISOV2|nr:cation diffusion facilitator family transporter [Isoptericola variabilis]AEG44980.1 cation diffusion facilitator family transporter [Isoptericola variabilis 225]TWH26008.1 cation diffusion facilitator family transporter [Isoptericola variabilis J7]